MSAPLHPWRRRAVLGAGLLALAGWVYYLPKLPELFRDAPVTRPMPGLPSFLELQSKGAVSAVNPAFAGLSQQTAPEAWRDLVPGLRAAPCDALFGPGAVKGVPVAFFTDVQCPNCRLLESRLDAFERANPGAITVIRHELPLLGPASVLGARAVLAAGLQGKAAAMARRLSRARLVADRGTLSALANSIGADPDRLLRDIDSRAVQSALDRDRALAELFGFYATPGIVVGRVAALGALSDSTLASLVAQEAADPGRACRGADRARPTD